MPNREIKSSSLYSFKRLFTQSHTNTAFPAMASHGWDIHAKEYAAMPFQGPMSGPSKRLLSALDDASPLSAATAILDVGCGSGLIISLLVSEYGNQIPTSARIIASDFSSGMIDCCREKQAQTVGTAEDIGGAWSRLETAIYDAQDLNGIKDGEISHVTGNLVYFMLPSSRKGLQEAHRVLKEGGALSLTSFRKVEWSDVMCEAAKRVRADASSGFDVKKMGPWASTEGLKGEFEACGFKNVKTEYFELNMPMADTTLFVNAFIRSNNPGALSILGEFTPEEVDRVCEEFIELVKGRDFLNGVVIVASGTK